MNAPTFLASLAAAACLLTAAFAAAAPEKPAKVPPEPPAPRQAPPNYAVINTLKITGEGPWQSVLLDPAGKLLFIPRATRTQVIDAATGKVVAEIGPATSARDVAVAPESNRGFITNGKEGTLTVFDLKTYAVLGAIPVGEDPDAILFDPKSKRLLVCCTTAKRLVPVNPDLDLKTGKPDPAIDLDGTPKGIVTDERGMVYLTLPDKDDIAVIDTRSMKIATVWNLGPWHGPTGISMDRFRSRLFVACGSRINILSATDGHDLGELVARKTDSWRFPPPATAFCDGHAFGTCGDGTLTVIGQSPTGKFEVQQMLQTDVGARPIAADPKTGKLYLPTEESDGKKVIPGTFKILVVEKK